MLQKDVTLMLVLKSLCFDFESSTNNGFRVRSKSLRDSGVAKMVTCGHCPMWRLRINWLIDFSFLRKKEEVLAKSQQTIKIRVIEGGIIFKCLLEDFVWQLSFIWASFTKISHDIYVPKLTYRGEKSETYRGKLFPLYTCDGIGLCMYRNMVFNNYICVRMCKHKKDSIFCKYSVWYFP